MANKGPSYGLSRQVQDKIDSKYDPELEQVLVEWISRQCGSDVGRPEAGKLGFQAWLKDGCVSVTLHVPEASSSSSSPLTPQQFHRDSRHTGTGAALLHVHAHVPLVSSHFFFLLPDPEPAGEQPVCWGQTREEDPELNHGLQTNGADLPVPEGGGSLRSQQDRHVPDRGPVGRSEPPHSPLASSG